MNDINIDICIATFHRKKLLHDLITSILNQDVCSYVKYRIIVVDNDNNGSAREVVNEIINTTDVEIVYDIEPEQNIALVRNKALSIARSDYVAFVDDDETVAQDWLQQLIDCAVQFSADVVFAPVVSVCPDNTPDWIIQGLFFNRKRHQTGVIRKHGGTGNALVKRSLFIVHGFMFNKHYGLTGGSDTALFHEISKSGFTMVWCDEAIVFETVIAKRLTVSWLIKRSFRGGQTYMRIYFADMNALESTIWFIKRILYVSLCILFVSISWVGGKPLIVKTLQKLSSNIGQLSTLTKYMYKEYEYN